MTKIAWSLTKIFNSVEMRGAHTSCSLNFHIYPLNRWMRNAMMSPGRCDDGGSVLMTTCRPCGCNSSKFVKTMR